MVAKISRIDVNMDAPDFKVADITLAEFGRKEIAIAESEMPALMAIREKQIHSSCCCLVLHFRNRNWKSTVCHPSNFKIL